MKKFYPKIGMVFSNIFRRNGLCKNQLIALFLFFGLSGLLPCRAFAQGLQFSYSYVNITRGSGGGTLEKGDIIEVHALVKVNITTNNFYYIDTIRTGTQYVNNSLKIVTNEGLLFRGTYTDAPLDDAGVYDISAGTPRLRVNLGTGAANPDKGPPKFGVTTGGGTVVPGDKPKFYGTTLFVVAYQLLITANYGDTIHLTGNYYLDTSGVKQTYRFNYAGIKIIQNQALCNNFSSASFTADSSFGSGNLQNRALPATVPGYTKVNMGLNSPQDNYYAIANNTSADGTTNNSGPYVPTANAHRVFNGFWDIIGDHTGAASTSLGNPAPAAGTTGGYMLVVNAAYPTGEAYRDTIKNVCPNTYYEFSAWIRNICGTCSLDSNSVQTYTPGVKPNLSYTINDVDYYTTGNLPYTQTWVKRGFIYKTGSAETQFRITIKNNAAGGGGNDWVLDDIKLATCYPNLTMNPNDTASTCANWPLHLSDTVKSYFNNYTNYCWEKSTNGTTWTATGVCGTKVPVLVNGLWQYVVDTVLTAKAIDSGTFYRLKVATTFPNLGNTQCAVNNSQKVFLKVYKVNCIILDSKILDFSGSIINSRSFLKWSTQNEGNLKEYVVEKSTDGVNFIRTGGVAAVNDIHGATYAFDDPENIQGIVYYRLRLESMDAGGDKYSKIIELYNRNAAFKMSAVNPFKNDLKIEFFMPADGNVDINLYDMYGKVVSKKSIKIYKGSSQVELDDVSRLTPGIYILRAAQNGIFAQNKLFKTD